MLAASRRSLGSVVFVTILGLADRSRADAPAEGRWLLGVESGRYAPLGVAGASIAYSLTPKLSLGGGLGVGFAKEESFERPYVPWAFFGKYNLYQNGGLRLGVSLGYSVEKRVTDSTLHRPNHPTETIEWQSPYGSGRINQSLFAEWRRGTFVATGTLGVYRALTSPRCVYDNGLVNIDFPCEAGLGFPPNEPSPWQGWASVGIGWAPQKSIPGKAAPEQGLGPDPALDRVVFAPTADTLPRGVVSIRNTTLAYSEIALGLSDNTQLTAFGIASRFVGDIDRYRTDKRSYLPVFYGLSFKARLPPQPAQRVHLAWLAYAATGTFFNFGPVSIVQTGPVLSGCFTKDCHSVISMHVLLGPVDFDPYYNRSGNTASFGLSGRFRFTEYLGFGVEASTGPISPMAAATIRFVTRSWFLDAGVFASGYPDFGAPIVSLGWTRF